MRITYIVAGAGDMYCGACARDVALIRELTSLGHDVSVTALYTPFHSDEESVLGTAPIYYGGINVFLQQVSPIFRNTPPSFDRLLDNRRLLKWASKFSIKTRAEDLGPMTISVLEGQNGQQKKELSRLIDHLKQTPEHGVVNITNSMLSGIAVQIKQQLGVPVVCTLQGEDGFVNMMPEPYRSKARALMQANAKSIDLFIAPGEDYAVSMSEFLSVDRSRIRVIHAGINTSTYSRNDARPNKPIVVGYLSVINRAKGLDLLAETFVKLVKEQHRDVILRVVGKVLEQQFYKAVISRLASEGLSTRYQHFGEVSLAGKLEFLKECSLFAVPTRIAESRGMAVMEALSMGVPVVVPQSGIFPEMMGLTDGGVMYHQGDVGSLASAIGQLIDNPDRADAMGSSGAAGIRTHFSAAKMAAETIQAYSELLH
ncbi:MAG: glycosyltransferase family 4 protein [Armatimonadota bacterium]